MRVSGLEALRGQARLTQEELANLSGLSKDTISKIESGKRSNVHSGTVSKLASSLEVDPAELSGIIPNLKNGSLATFQTHECLVMQKRLDLFTLGTKIEEHSLDLLLDLARELLEVDAGVVRPSA